MEPELGIFHVIVFPRGQEDYVHVPSGQETGPDGLSAELRTSVLLRSSMLTVMTVKSEVV